MEEKRSFYKGNVTTVDQIPTWSEYWDKNKFNISKTIEKTDKVDEKLAGKVSIWQGDITSLQIDAIVNAANSSLLGGGGGTKHSRHKIPRTRHVRFQCTITVSCSRRGYSQSSRTILENRMRYFRGMSSRRSQNHGGLHDSGEMLVTSRQHTGSRLVRYAFDDNYVPDIIHTVGPQGEKPEKLRDCYENSLSLARENQLRIIAFPCISTGIYGYPQRPAAKVALSAVKKFLVENKDVVRPSVRFFSIFAILSILDTRLLPSFSGGQGYLLFVPEN